MDSSTKRLRVPLTQNEIFHAVRLLEQTGVKRPFKLYVDREISDDIEDYAKKFGLEIIIGE